MSVPTPYYPQLEERDCGATCLRMVAEAYGRRESMVTLRELTDTDARGTNLGGIERGARALGFDTLAAELPFDELSAGDLLPAILHWDRDHFVVVTEASYSSVKVHDPASGVRTFSRDDFEAHRYGPGRSRAGLIVRPGPDSVQNTVAEVPVGDGQETAGTEASVRQPLLVVAAAVLFAAVTGVALGVIRTSIHQAIDLQFREGWLRQLGAMLAVTAAFSLAAFLVRRLSIAYAGAHGAADVDTIARHIKVRAADVRRPVDPETYLTLLADSDELRIWRAYSLPKLATGVVTLLAALIYLLVIDWVWGVVAGVLLAILAGIATAVYRYGQRNREAAVVAQRQQREAMFEFAQQSPDVHTIDDDSYLESRLGMRTERAQSAFYATAAEYSAERQLVSIGMLLAFVALLATGLYRLGFSGLQLGDTVFGLVAVLACLLPLWSICSTYVRWQRLRASRLRLQELGAPGVVLAGPRTPKPSTLTLQWDGPTGQRQALTFPATSRVAFVGSDVATRACLMAGLLGRPNGCNAALYFDEDTDEVRDVSEVGPYSWIRRESLVASGSLANNIAMDARPDERAVEAAARLVGLPIDAPPRGLHTLVGFNGEGIDDELAARTLIARAVYRNVDCILLDGATDPLSAYDEGLLMDNLLPWCEDRLLVVNPERVNAAYGCDLIVHVEAGEIEALGSHEQLLRERGSYYYDVVAAQERIV